jgi:hypothetical protein
MRPQARVEAPDRKVAYMEIRDWAEGFPGAVTLADKEGKIVYMNAASRKGFAKSGGGDLVGRNLSSCHKPASTEKIAAIIATGVPNAYTIEKGGVHKLIYQAPWTEGATTLGIVEISFEIPADMPHHIRD